MDKKIQRAKAFAADRKNRTAVVMTGGGVAAVVAGIITFIAKAGKTKR